MGRRSLVAIAALVTIGAGGTGVTFLVMATFFGQTVGGSALGNSTSCTAVINAASGTASLDRNQSQNAWIIVQTGQDLGIPPRGLVIAVATALQESNLRNLSYGDRDSVGLFQQRPSAGWGSPSELMDPPIAARRFYRALAKVHGWESMPLTDAAQAVQRSAFPFAYAKWESLAQTLVMHLRGRTIVAASLPEGKITCGESVGAALPAGLTGEMLRVARNQLGKPYVWSATGPDAFDCSGLIVYSWRKVGHPLAVRTSQQMYQVSTPIQPGSEQAGDLLFGDFTATGPEHVMMVIAPGTAIEAPHTGDVVKIVPYETRSWKIGRLTSSAFRGGRSPY